MSQAFLETLKSVDGKVQNLSFHQARYESVLHSLGVKKFPRLSKYLHPPKDSIQRCRIIYTQENLSVSYHPYVKRSVKLLKLMYDDTIEYEKKYANREILDKLFSQKEEADDILIIKNEKVTDTSIANIAFFDGKKWLTPKEPLLQGTTRQRLLDNGFLKEADIYEKDLKQYKKVALLNAMIDFDIISEENTRDIYC